MPTDKPNDKAQFEENKPLDRQMFEFVTDAAAAVESGKCVAIALVVVRDDGSTVMQYRYMNDTTALMVLGGVTLVQRNIADSAQERMRVQAQAAAKRKADGA